MPVDQYNIERWGRAPSEGEEARCQRTVDGIRGLIEERYGGAVDVYLQGSYRNRTNVKQDSDVDIVAEHTGYFFADTSSLTEEDRRRYDASRVAADYEFSSFKNDLHSVLANRFGAAMVEQKNKCIRINKNEYRVNADVVACYQYKRFAAFEVVEAQGIAFMSDEGVRIEGFPKQHYERGAAKNTQTEGMYKRAVRALKIARNNMEDTGLIRPDTMPSFLLECLVWNVPDSEFGQASLYEVLRRVIYRVWEDMGNPDRARNYAEVSDLRWLLRGNNAAKDTQLAREFMHRTWGYIGF